MDSTSTTGAAKTGLTSASAGLIISTIADNEATATAYTQAAGNIESISTLGTFTSPTAGKCRFKEVDATNHPGLYEIQIADARWAVSGARSLIVSVSGASGAAQVDCEVQLVAVDAQDAVRFGLTALPNAAASAANGLVTVGTGSGQLGLSSGAVTVATNNDKTGYALSGSQTFNNTGTWIGNVSGSVGSVSGNVGGNVSGSVGSVTAVVSANMTQINGTAIDGKADENFNVFFGNAGATTTKVVDDVGTGAGGSSDWTATEKNQIRYRLGVDGTTATPATNSPNLGTVAANVTQWLGTAAATPTVAGVPEVDITHVLGQAAQAASGAIDANVVQVAGQTANASGAINFSNLDVAVSSRSTYAGADTAGTTTLLSLLTPTRAGYLDNLASAPPTSAAIADAVWDEPRASHTTAGSFGLYLDSQVSLVGGLDAAGVRSAIGMASANLDAQLSNLATPAEVNAEVLSVINTGTLIDGKTVVQAIRIIAAAVGGIITDAGSSVEHFRGLDGATTRLAVTVDATGNRTAVSYP